MIVAPTLDQEIERLSCGAEWFFGKPVGRPLSDEALMDDLNRSGVGVSHAHFDVATRRLTLEYTYERGELLDQSKKTVVTIQVG